MSLLLAKAGRLGHLWARLDPTNQPSSALTHHFDLGFVWLCLRLCAPACLQGKPSRSLQAAFKLIDEAGLTADDVVHLERGLYGWYQAELPMVGECLECMLAAHWWCRSLGAETGPWLGQHPAAGHGCRPARCW